LKISLVDSTANPGVKVEIAIAPWSGALDKIVASIMAGNPPDLTIVGQGYPQTLAETGGLVELSDFVNEIGGKDAFLGSSLSILGSSQDGGVYSVPLYITPTVLYYRESLIKKAGITKLPTTWDEYYEMCKAVTDPANNVYGFAIPLGDNHGTKTIWGFMQSNGVNLVNVDKNGKWYVDLEGDKFDALKEV
jgi:ABC-type glycerol-3-phosphate transport system substrate-binding protein